MNKEKIHHTKNSDQKKHFSANKFKAYNKFSSVKNNNTTKKRQSFGKKFTRDIPSFNQKSISKNQAPKAKKNSVRIITLGGFEEVGRNMFAVEYENEIFIFDAGFQFVSDYDTPGIDFSLPNISYLVENKHKIKALIITHAHLDHIGGIPFIMDKIGNPPIYTRYMTSLIIKKRMEEFPEAPELKIKLVEPGDKKRIGDVSFEFFDVYHSIPDSMGIMVKTKYGNIVITGDLKLKHTDGILDKKEEETWEKISKEKNIFLISDSTNCENPGWSLPEKRIHENVKNYIKNAQGRVIIANFASQFERMIAFVKAAEDLGKKVALEGRSIKVNMEIAKEAKYFIPKKDTLIDIDDVDKYPADKIVVIATGGQGEKYAALPRMARGDHKSIKINKRDTIIFSSSVIPGNEIAVRNLMDIIMRRDPRVIHYRTSDVHSTGHGNAEELSYIIRKVHPKYFIPGYGFHSMLKTHKELAIKEGVLEENVLVADNGSVIEMNEDGNARILDIKAPSTPMMIDGNTVTEVQKIVMEDRLSLSTDGFIHIVALINVSQKKLQKSPDIISRGFIYLKDSQSLISQTRSLVVKITEKELLKNRSNKVDILEVKKSIQMNVEKFLRQKTNKNPIVIATVLVI